MRIQITTQNMSLTNALRELVHTRLRHALGRFAHRIQDAAVSFEDVNGPRGGRDMQCRIKLLLRPRGEVNVSAVAVFPGAALSEAAQRACRCVRSRTRRRWMLRRRTRDALDVGSAA
ncbi:MAG: HPF/RaiA family ribosome-associated protein [Planctomycetota bacterium]|nr:HPF/RaiA family ribosome-associated protein [Pseudomonadales bacterium]